MSKGEDPTMSESQEAASPQELRDRLSTALEADLGAKAVWRAAELCPNGHDAARYEWVDGGNRTDWVEYPWAAGDLCRSCITAAMSGSADVDVQYARADRLVSAHQDDPTWHPEWRVPREPVDWTDLNVLAPRWKKWDADSLRRYFVGEWLEDDGITVILVSRGGDVHEGRGVDEGMARARAWDALLRAERGGGGDE